LERACGEGVRFERFGGGEDECLRLRGGGDEDCLRRLEEDVGEGERSRRLDVRWGRGDAERRGERDFRLGLVVSRSFERSLLLSLDLSRFFSLDLSRCLSLDRSRFFSLEWSRVLSLERSRFLSLECSLFLSLDRSRGFLYGSGEASRARVEVRPLERESRETSFTASLSSSSLDLTLSSLVLCSFDLLLGVRSDLAEASLFPPFGPSSLSLCRVGLVLLFFSSWRGRGLSLTC
jgi:hypothetical protein